MRRPDTIERLYLDFDGFFASVMQQTMPALRGRPVGVIPFETDKAQFTTVIACSKEAKAYGVKNVMRTPDAQKLCPDIVLVTQRPDLFRRAHNALLNEIACEIPIDTVKSIDELTCKLAPRDIRRPEDLAQRLKKRIAGNVGPHITCSIGFAANRLLAKMACKIDKPNGVTIWRPEQMPVPLLPLPLSEISGVGPRMEKRLNRAGISDMQSLLATQPKQMRALWGNVNGERMWYALHGYDLQAQPTGRSMYGHGRVLPPELRNIDKARDCARLLLSKAARRMRRDRFYANRLWVWLDLRQGGWFGQRDLPSVQDDQACLVALEHVWAKARRELPRRHEIIRVGVTLLDLAPADGRQLDIFLNDDRERQRWERITFSIDTLNRKFGKRVLSVGPWTPPPGGYAGGKISYTRIPSAEDFW
jgi:DNA polymerase-4